MRVMRSWRQAACLCLLLAVSLAGCGDAGHAARGALRIPVYGGIDIPDPARAHSRGDLFIDSLLYSGLVKFSPDLHVIPELAVSLPTISFSGLTYTFTIRQDARFADGKPCTARDVVYSLSRALRIGGADARRALGGIVGARAVERRAKRTPSGLQVLDRLTLRIHLATPDADFLQKLAFPVASVVDHRVVPDRVMQGWPGAPAGTGSWIVSQRNRAGDLVLSPRPHFYASLQLRSLVLVPVRDPSAGLALYRKGALDVAQVPPTDIARMSSNAELRQTNALAAYYAVPLSGSALSLAAGLDRNQLVQDAGMGLTALDTVVPPSVPDYVSSPPAIDPPTGATASTPPVSILLSAPSDPVMQSLQRALGRQWRSTGAVTAARVKIFEVTHLLPDPGDWIRIALPKTHSSWLRRSLRSARRLTNDPVDRMNVYDACERWVLQKGFVIPLATGSIAYLMKPAVQGLQVTPSGVMPENNNWALAVVS